MKIMQRAVVAGFVAAVLGILGAPTMASAQQVYEVSQLTEKPRIASPMAAQQAIQRAYPRSLQARGVEGRVVLEFVLKADGHVDPASVVVQQSESDGLSDAAKQAIEEIQFVPGTVSGSAVATRVVFPITFVAG